MKTNRVLVFFLGGLVTGMVGMFLFEREFAPRSRSIEKDESAPSDRSQAMAQSGAQPNADRIVVAAEIEWPSARGEELDSLELKLAALGCPGDLMRDILLAEANRSFSSNFARFCDEYLSRKGKFAAVNEAIDRQFEDLLRKRQESLLRVLGPKLRSDDEEIGKVYRPLEKETVFLTEDKATKLSSLKQQYAAQIQSIIKNEHGFQTQADAQQIATLQKQEEDAIKGVLSPEEYQTYQTLVAACSPAFEDQYGNFGPTSDEIPALTKYHERFAKVAQETDPAAAQSQWMSELNSEIGPARAQELLNFNNPDYVEARALAARFGLPNDSVDKLFDLERQTSEQVYAIMNSPETFGADESQRREAAHNLAISQQAQLEQILGPDAAASYLNNSSYTGWITAP